MQITPLLLLQLILLPVEIELTATDGGFIKLTDGDLDNAGLAKLGLEGQSAVGTADQVVLTYLLNGATSSLATIDSN